MFRTLQPLFSNLRDLDFFDNLEIRITLVKKNKTILLFNFTNQVQSSLTEKELKSYSKAGTVAEEVLGGIRTVAAFSGEEKEMERYQKNLQPAEDNGKKKGLFSGIGNGVMWFIIYCIYALAFW